MTHQESSNFNNNNRTFYRSSLIQTHDISAGADQGCAGPIWVYPLHTLSTCSLCAFKGELEGLGGKTPQNYYYLQLQTSKAIAFLCTRWCVTAVPVAPVAAMGVISRRLHKAAGKQSLMIAAPEALALCGTRHSLPDTWFISLKTALNILLTCLLSHKQNTAHCFTCCTPQVAT